MAKRRTAAHIQAALKAVTRDVTKGLTVGDSCRRHRLFGRLVGWRGWPRSVRCDNGGEFVGAALAEWLKSKGVELRAVAPGSPWENGFVESFHSRLRDEFLDRTAFVNVADAKAQAEAFKREFNTVRPHSGLGYKTPREFAATCGKPGADKTKNPGERKTAK